MLLHGPERFILMLYQFEYIELKASLLSDIFLLAISEMRTFAGCTSGFIVQAIICERIFATYYIWHYEDSEKPNVFKIVLFGLFCFSGTCTVVVPIWYSVSPILSIAVAMSFYIVFAGIMFVIYWRLWVYNHDVLHVLSDMHFGEMEYTLGVRFQVEENIRAIKLLRIFVVFNSVFVGANCLFGIVVMMISDQEKPSGQVALQLLEFSIAVYTLSMLLISLYFVKDWGEQFKMAIFKVFGRDIRHSAKNSIVPLNTIQETEIYFNYYNRNW